jgi:hypothetical protein
MGEGVAFLIHQSVTYSPIDTSFLKDDHTECLAVRVVINGSDLVIFNVYLPPASSCPSSYKTDLSPIFYHTDDDTLVCGDLNAHHEGWDVILVDPRGEKIADQIEHCPLLILNDANLPTRLPNNGSSSSPDLTLASAHVALASTWATNVKLNSDHLPITVTLPSDEAPPQRAARSYINFRKANWPLFIRESEAAFRDPQRPTSCSAGVRIFNKIISKAAKHAVLVGLHRNHAPGISWEVAELIREHDERKTADPTDPLIPDLNITMNKIINDNKHSIWRDKIHTSGSRPDSTKLWNLVRGLSGKKMFVPKNQPIFFNSKIQSSPKKISECFIKHYVPLPRSNPITCRIRRRLYTQHPLDHDFNPFNIALTTAAIQRSSSSTATGPDGLCSLTDIFNLLVRDNYIPAVWKSALVIPVLKPGKPADQGASYRPISLISPVVKILERLLLPDLTSSFTLSPSQHGFRSDHSTITALLPIVSQISQTGFRYDKHHFTNRADL